MMLLSSLIHSLHFILNQTSHLEFINSIATQVHSYSFKLIKVFVNPNFGDLNSLILFNIFGMLQRSESSLTSLFQIRVRGLEFHWKLVRFCPNVQLTGPDPSSVPGLLSYYPLIIISKNRSWWNTRHSQHVLFIQEF